MKKNSKRRRESKSRKEMGKLRFTVGLDPGDKYSHYCVLDEAKEIVQEGRVRTTPWRGCVTHGRCIAASGDGERLHAGRLVSFEPGSLHRPFAVSGSP